VGFVLFRTTAKKTFMRTTRKTLRARFAPETRYEVAPIPAVPFRATCETELEHLKERLLRQALADTADADFYAPLRRAANEAASVAWMTPFPLLFLPELFAEKQSAARQHAARQRNVRARSREILTTVA
jgi:hypothetical protein